jgi:hypothetical protein
MRNIARTLDKGSATTVTLASGANTIRHRQQGIPAGVEILVNEAGTLSLQSFTTTYWNVTASAAGDVKLRWVK